MERSRFDEAEPLVAEGLMRASERGLRKIVHGQRIEIANQRSDPSEMLQRAEAAAAEFPEEGQFRWAAIVALYRQGDLQRAYQYLREHNVEALDRPSLLLEVILRSRLEKSLETIDWLLDLAEASPSDEEFLAVVLGSIFEASQELELSEQLSTRLNSLVGGFLSEFPSSELFFVVEAPDIETLIDEIRAMLEPRTMQRAETAEKVSLGQMPFGMMQVAWEEALRADAGQRRRRRTGRHPARCGHQATRTRSGSSSPQQSRRHRPRSGIMLWQRLLNGSPTIKRCFSEILMPTELLADMRAAEHAAQVPVLGSMGIHPATGDMWVSEADPEQVRVTQDAISDLLSVADSCTHVESTNLTMLDSEDVPSPARPLGTQPSESH